MQGNREPKGGTDNTDDSVAAAARESNVVLSQEDILPRKERDIVRLMCIGDVVGRSGRSILGNYLAFLRRFYEVDFVIANGENAAGGSGITQQIYDKFKKYGIDIITLGDHCFRRKDAYTLLSSADDIIRPANLPSSALGRGYAIRQLPSGKRIAVIVVAGRIFMKPIFDCPFTAVRQIINRIYKKEADIIVVEIHGEATSEKVAMGWFLDGKASLVYGTHTHIPTADCRILPSGTGYITDIGMTGPYDSVLGRRKEKVLKAFISGMPEVYDVACDDLRLGAIVADINPYSGRCKGVYPLFLKEGELSGLKERISRGC